MSLKRRSRRSRSATVAVVGLGYVGLPLAVEFAKAGFNVIGYDVSERVVDLLMEGKSHIQDVPARDVAALVKAGKFEATTDESRLKEADAISIAVPTPLGEDARPGHELCHRRRRGGAAHGTPGTAGRAREHDLPGHDARGDAAALRSAGLTVGEDVFLAFSPERVDPGNPKYHTKNTPKVVGGITPACTEVATALYATCIDTVVPVRPPRRRSW